jgi:urease accessory protein
MLLADGRFPSGGHAHSNGMEEACDRGLVGSVDDLSAFLAGRLQTSGVLSMHAAGGVCAAARAGRAGPSFWAAIDAELDARILAPGARAVSRQQGSQLLRAALQVLDAPAGRGLRDWAARTGAGPHHPVALGAVAADAGLQPGEASALAGYTSVSGPASAAVRLLGLDPGRVAAVLAGLSVGIDALAADVAGAVARPGWTPTSLPARAAPISDLLAEVHHQRKERLFAS